MAGSLKSRYSTEECTSNPFDSSTLYSFDWNSIGTTRLYTRSMRDEFEIGVSFDECTGENSGSGA